MGSGLAGIRPVVNLKTSVYVTGGTGTKNDPYIIKNYGTDTYKNARFTGYWFNWNNEHADPALDTATNLKLKDVPTYYDYVNVAFGITATGSENGTIDFSVDEYLASHLGGYTKEEFISDVNTLKQRGQKVILSIGGASASITLDSDADVNRFIDSTEALINEYGFDGIDIDIENTINTANLEKAIKGVLDKHDDDFILTCAIETVDFQVNANVKAQGRYLDMILNLKNDIDLVNIQVYNTGSQYGIDKKDYTPGTLDFAVAIPTILLEK
jgi:chitinase